MKFELLRHLKCPYCGQNIKIEKIVFEEGDELINGCVKCECSNFPVLCGILLLKESPLKDQVIKFIKEGLTEEALICCLWPEKFEIIDSVRTFLQNSLGLPRALGTAISHLAQIKAEKASKKLFKQYSSEKSSFFSLLGSDLFESYLKHRFSTDSFWSLYPFIPLLKAKKERILDLNCGAGHASFVISNYVEPGQLVSADISFKLLYLGKKYFAPKAQFICIDTNFPLPFENGLFSSIVMSDALQYVHSRIGLAREMKRTLSPKGLLLLLHVHNSLTFNPGAGYALSPKSWTNLFEVAQIVIKTIPELKVVQDFIFENKLDLTQKHAEEVLNSANGLIFLSTLDKSLLTTYSNVDQEFLEVKDNLIINPIFKARKSGDKILLERPDCKLFSGDSYQFSEHYLPRKTEINGNIAEGIHVDIPDTSKVEDLMKKFVLINVPNNYV